MDALNPTIPRWSIDEYVIQAERFSGMHSILVEGRTDKDVVARVLGAYHGDDWSRRFHIDTAEFIESPRAQPLGNREKVEAVFDSVSSPHSLTGLVDREYRGYTEIDYSNELINDVCIKDALYWTRGHSIENAFLDRDIIKEVIRRQFPNCTDNKFFEAIDEVHFSLVLECAALCLALHDLELLRLFSDVRNWDFRTLWLRSELGMHISESHLLKIFDAKKLDIDRQKGILTRFNSLRYSLISHSVIELEGLCHGHYGIQLYWNGLALLAVESFGQVGDDSPRLAKFGDGDGWRLAAISAVLNDKRAVSQRAPFILKACKVAEAEESPFEGTAPS